MNRIEKIQASLPKWEVDLFVVDNPIDLFYLTGQKLSAGRLVVSAAEVTLYVDGRYYEACKSSLSIPVALLAREAPFPAFEGKRIGFDAFFTTFQEYEKLAALKGERVPLSSPIRSIREIKDPSELELLRRAGELGSQGYDYIVDNLVEGITEEELAAELEIFWRKKGGEKVAFAPHIAFGENSAYPHYHPGKRALKKGDLVLIDIGVVLNQYNSDMTRVVFFGTPDPKLEEIYQIVHEAQLQALSLCKPGTMIAELDSAARDLIESRGYGEHFLHSLGHGVGLEVHEGPWVRKNGIGKLKEGMVLTIEPGIYLAGKGGVRLEDTIAITKSGFENLTSRPILSSPTIQ